MKKFTFKRIVQSLTVCLSVLSVISCGDSEPALEDNPEPSKDVLVGAWRLITDYDNRGLVWFFPNNKCYSLDGDKNGSWSYNSKKAEITTDLSTFSSINITDWVDIDEWKGYSPYWGSQLIKAFKRSNESYMEGVWNMIELQEGYSFPITEFSNVKFPNNQITGDCVIQAGYNTYYAKFTLDNPYSDNLRLTIRYNQLYDGFIAQEFSCGGKWK